MPDVASDNYKERCIDLKTKVENTIRGEEKERVHESCRNFLDALDKLLTGLVEKFHSSPGVVDSVYVQSFIQDTLLQSGQNLYFGIQQMALVVAFALQNPNLRNADFCRLERQERIEREARALRAAIAEAQALEEANQFGNIADFRFTRGILVRAYHPDQE